MNDPFSTPYIGPALNVGRRLVVGPGAETLTTEEQIARGIMGLAVLGSAPSALPSLQGGFAEQNALAQQAMTQDAFQERYRELMKPKEQGGQGLSDVDAFMQAASEVPQLSGYRPPLGPVSEFAPPPLQEGLEAGPPSPFTPPGPGPTEPVTREGVVLPLTASDAALRSGQRSINTMQALGANNPNFKTGYRYDPVTGKVSISIEERSPQEMMENPIISAASIAANPDIMLPVKLGYMELVPYGAGAFRAKFKPGAKEFIERYQTQIAEKALQFGLNPTEVLGAVYGATAGLPEGGFSKLEINEAADKKFQEELAKLKLEGMTYTAEERAKLRDLVSAKADLVNYWTALKDSGALRPQPFTSLLDRGQYAVQQYAKLYGGDPKLVAVYRMQQALQSRLARALFEQKGNLAIYEQQAAMKSIMSFLDDEAIGTENYNRLLKMIDDHIQAVSTHVSPFREGTYFLNTKTGELTQASNPLSAPRPRQRRTTRGSATPPSGGEGSGLPPELDDF